MRTCLFAALLGCGLYGIPAPAQDKVAEGEYLMRWVSDKGTPETKTTTRWVLTTASSSRYHLESEVLDRSDGMRVVQSEELNKQMAPTAIGYDFYQQDDKAAGNVRCKFVGGSITCTAYSDSGRDADSSKPFKHRGPFWLSLVGLFTVDLDWLMDGAVNMAHLEKGRKTSITTMTVWWSGAEDWDFHAYKEMSLEFVGTETVQLNRVTVAAKHYVLKDNEVQNLWIAAGILVKISGPEAGDETLVTNYKQYKKLIPELPVLPRAPGGGPTPQKPT
ncbi:MAG TPA: hypothetical protein VI488_08605 [Candidatus Angelobacter sp.]